jgi:hypothetical protein
LDNRACRSGDAGFPPENWFFREKSPDSAEEPRVPKPAMPVSSRVPVPEVLPAVMPQLPVVPEFLPAPPPALVLPERLPAGLPAGGRTALAAALAGELPALPWGN